MAQIEVLVPEVRTHVSGAPDATCELYLQRAVKQFCKDSQVWIVDLGETTIDPPGNNIHPQPPVEVLVPDSDNADTPWTLPANSYMQAVSKIKLADREIERVSGAEPPKYWYDIVEQKLYIEAHYVTSSDMKLEVYAVLTPKKNAVEIPEFLVERYSEGIASYAIAQMLMMPNQDWTDMRSAGMMMKQYSLRVSEARIGKARGGTTGKIALKPKPF